MHLLQHISTPQSDDINQLGISKINSIVS